MRSLIKFASVFLIACASICAQAQLWSGVLDPNRATDWTFAGVTGGIPTNWTQCGPTINPGASATTIVNALNHTGAGYTGCTANTYIQLAAGTFNLSQGICVHGVSGTELRGMGADQTHLVYAAGSSCGQGVFISSLGFEDAAGEFPGGNPTAVNWTAGFSKGATQITVTNAAMLNITAGKTMLILDQCDTGYSGSPCTGSAVDNGNYFVCGDVYNPVGPLGCSVNGVNGGAARPHRWQEETVVVTACSPTCSNPGSTVLTINTPLIHPNWATGQSPQVWAVQAISFVGVRNLSINNAAVTNANNTPGLSFTNAHDFWATGVAVLNAKSQGIVAYFLVSNYEISSNYVYNSGQNSPGVDPNPNDPSNIIYAGESGIIQNNISQASRIGIGGTVAPATGNVIAYNYLPNCFESNTTLWGCLYEHHQNGTDYNLYEGNVVAQILQDQVHGGSLMQTFYRNFSTGWESCSNGNCGTLPTQKNATLFALGDLSFNRYDNIIANVLGTPGISTAGYTFTAAHWFNGGATSYIYNWESGNTAGTGQPPIDPVVGTTAMRWGNWDAFNNTTRWVTSEVPSGISVFPNPVPTTTCTATLACPPSFYLTSRPSWWSSSIPFPAIGPDVTGGNVGQCAGTVNTANQFALVPATSSGNCANLGLNSAWAGHVNAIPAMQCFLNVMNGPPDGAAPSGIGSALTFSASACYPAQVTTPSVSLSCAAGNPCTSLPFASQNVNTTSPSQAVTLTNTGTAVLSITSISITGTNASAFFQTNNCPIGSNLGINSSCTITVTFTPLSAGALSASVQLVTNAADSPESFSLSGTGVQVNFSSQSTARISGGAVLK